MEEPTKKNEELKDAHVPHRGMSFLESLNAAIEGFIYVVKNERNMRIHFTIAFVVLMAAFFIGVSRIEWILLSICVFLVLGAEMVNTVIEETMDFIQVTYHPVIQMIKDVSAGIVLIAVMNALVVGTIIFSKYSAGPFGTALESMRSAPWQITFTALLVVVFIIIAGKVFFRRGKPLKGGIMSGHAAIAFSLWTTVLYLQTNVFVIFVTLLLALLVIQSRVRAKIHTIWEVIGGAVVGVLVTALFFQFLTR